ncbi:MAG TPA: SprB repeat-containing protein, partial [Chitinophagales bacterium]|nr:SprB repeat-containing protein [Chitinophagales bacterium]
MKKALLHSAALPGKPAAFLKSGFLHLIPFLLFVMVADYAMATNGTGVVTVTGNGGSCVGYTAASGNGPDNWEVAEGGSYTMTITGVTECSGSAITVFVQNSNNGNFCFNATGSGGTYVGTFNMPNPSCFTSPISYKCGGDQPCDNANTYNADGPSHNGKVHLRASFFNGSCVKTETDEDCSGTSCAISLGGNDLDVSCFDATDGSIDITVTGAQGSVSYLWNDGITTEDRTGLAAGTYSVTVTDQAGCTASQTFTITGPSVLNATGVKVDEASALGSDG